MLGTFIFFAFLAVTNLLAPIAQAFQGILGDLFSAVG